jgi:hypothetical protein
MTGTPEDTYRALLGRLAEAEGARIRERDGVHEWYAHQVAGAEEAVALAAKQVAEAEHSLITARGAVEFTEAESANLWRILASRLRVRDVTALGPPPFFDDAEPVSGHPARLLEHVREMLDQVVPLRPRRSPRRLVLALVVLVVLAGAVIAALALLRH